ncbi:hypothetical protein L1049_006278 [Liquidambar formosana]|uniref:At2g35280-like TPR domain-containing protein n=1 Tax=Liquidambar formosana TaxID=63359 RepID=A0AAP0WQT5_LIQFO
MAASGLHSFPSAADAVVWDSRQNKKSKWDKVDGDRRNTLPSGGQDSISTLGHMLHFYPLLMLVLDILLSQEEQSLGPNFHFKGTKKQRITSMLRVPPIFLLNNELIVDILAHVGASSFMDLFNAKLCCKVFNEAAKHDLVYMHVCLKKIPTNPWCPSEQLSSFLMRCRECGNPEALFRQGLLEYFNREERELGLNYFQRATISGHIEASYILGIINLCSGELGIGIQLLDSIRRSRVTRVGECRRKLKAALATLCTHILAKGRGVLDDCAVEEVGADNGRSGISLYTHDGHGSGYGGATTPMAKTLATATNVHQSLTPFSSSSPKFDPKPNTHLQLHNTFDSKPNT